MCHLYEYEFCPSEDTHALIDNGFRMERQQQPFISHEQPVNSWENDNRPNCMEPFQQINKYTYVRRWACMRYANIYISCRCQWMRNKTRCARAQISHPQFMCIFGAPQNKKMHSILWWFFISRCWLFIFGCGPTIVFDEWLLDWVPVQPMFTSPSTWTLNNYNIIWQCASAHKLHIIIKMHGMASSEMQDDHHRRHQVPCSRGK